MSNSFSFELEDEDSLISVDCYIGKYKYDLALDTGASNTVIDVNALFAAGYRIEDAIRIVEIETAGGVIEAYVFKFLSLKHWVLHGDILKYRLMILSATMLSLKFKAY